MKDRKEKTRAAILAGGGIVLRGDRKPQVAIVQLRKLSAWVLPKGKLAANESVLAAARREVLEETGHRVSIHEFLGTLAYEAGGRPKVVQFWRMQAIGGPVRELMRDVKAVQWLPLDDAIAQLTHAREQAFLEQVGPVALKSAERSARRAISAARPAPRRSAIERVHPASRTSVVEPFGPSDVAARLIADAGPFADPQAIEAAEPIAPDLAEAANLAWSDADFAPAPGPSQFQGREEPEAVAGQNLIEKNLIEKTWVWFRQTALPSRRD
jgi:8-oxo-dGTP diphosphatase